MSWRSTYIDTFIQGGEKVEIEIEENNVLTEFKIEELDVAERRDLEQYFFSRDTLIELIKVLALFQLLQQLLDSGDE